MKPENTILPKFGTINNNCVVACGIPGHFGGVPHDGYIFAYYKYETKWKVGVPLRADEDIRKAVERHEKKYPPKTTYHYRFFKEAK